MHALPRVRERAPSSINHRNQRMEAIGMPTINGEARSYKRLVPSQKNNFQL